MTLDKYGAGCRCLLRACENLGQPYLTDRAFIAQHSMEYPDWAETPGAAGTERLIALSRRMGLAHTGNIVKEYAEVLAAHQAGAIVLITTKTEPRRAVDDAAGAEQIALLESMGENFLTLWAPASDGSHETPTYSREDFWDRAGASAIILR